MYATSELGEVRIMVCRSMLASDSGEMDSALFLLSRGVSRGLEKRDTAQKRSNQGFRGGGSKPQVFFCLVLFSVLCGTCYRSNRSQVKLFSY